MLQAIQGGVRVAQDSFSAQRSRQCILAEAPEHLYALGSVQAGQLAAAKVQWMLVSTCVLVCTCSACAWLLLPLPPEKGLAVRLAVVLRQGKL